MAGLPEENIEYVYWLAPSCNLGTAASAYTTTPAPGLATVMLWQMNIRIPPGHAGVTGIALVDSNSFIIPYSQSTPSWFVGDDDDLTFNYGKQTGSNVVVATYNTSTLYNHGWQLRFVYTPVSALVTDGGGVVVTPDVADWAHSIESTTGGQ